MLHHAHKKAIPKLTSLTVQFHNGVQLFRGELDVKFRSFVNSW
jgi:hypothetical protein